MSLFGPRTPSTIHVYHHYESKPCEKCGYRSNTGYPDPEWLHEHFIHTIQDSSTLIDRILDQKPQKKLKKSKDTKET